MVGTTVSHYRILDKLGEGGMGVVYSAEDSKLKRTVALKFLPKALEAHEPERSRFLQEAQAAAALNHPHICTIHDIQEHEGQQFIVMEYVDGVTLRQKITAKGGIASGLPLSEAVTYALQIGEALQEAHAKGIIHRDIKADNIMITSSGQVKVMDFGLAKLKGSLKLTKTSSTVGTLAYMAPEHIEGKETDARADIFSFGIVLFEMLTGHLPFRGEHDAAMMYSILSEAPDPVQRYLPDAPSELAHILSRALEKDPEDRYQTVRDMVIDLRRLKKETGRVLRTVPTAAHPVSTEGAPGATPAATPRRRGRLVVVSLLAAAVVVAVGVIILLLPKKLELNPDMKSRVVQIPFRNVFYADMSRDGNWIVFPAADEQGRFDVYMMNIAQRQPRRITFDSCYGIFNTSLSPDAGTILYSRIQSVSGRTEIVSVSSTGGAGRVILEGVASAYWLPDGGGISYVSVSGFAQTKVVYASWTCRPDGSDRRLMLADTMGRRPGLRNAFAYSRDGRRVAWTKNFPEGYSEIMLRDLETGTDRQLTFDKKIADDPLWTPSGDLVFSSSRAGNFNLWTIPATGGEPVQLTRGSGPDQAPTMTADGKRLMYSEIIDVGQIKIASLMDGAVRQLTVEDRARGMAAISPDGRYIAFPAEGGDIASEERNIYVMDRNGQNVRQLTDDSTYKIYPSWSLNGQWVAYAARPVSEPDDSSRVFLIHAEKPAQPRMLGRGVYAKWLTEKEFVLWGPSGTWKGAIDSPACARFSDDSTLAAPVLDGRYVVTLGTRGRGIWSIVAADSYKGHSGMGRVLINRWTYALLSRGGREMYYAEPRTGEIHRVSLPDGREQTLKPSLPGLGMFFSMSSDGKEVSYTEHTRKTRFVLIENPFR